MPMNKTSLKLKLQMHLIQKVIDLNVMDWVVPKHCNSEKPKVLDEDPLVKE